MPNDAAVRMWREAFGEWVEADPVAGYLKKFKVPAHAIPANMGRAVDVYYSARKKDTPPEVPDFPSKRYKLSVLTVPQGKLSVLECAGAQY
ncbi:hypothetical protein [Pseudomonas sp. Irchel s3a18]|uniref:hypothetical protein n=1 Tax=Pseudomonas sp. Irchel s3a18 TaxID=2009053 RepID=UPI000FA26D72|nr:hypothetical protein [Pseudomonas sp. Irchel s3a18]